MSRILFRRAVLGRLTDGLLAAMTLPALTLSGAALPAAAMDTPPGRKPRPPRRIVLDPGHGGRDPGAIGGRGLMEKDVVLDVAKDVARRMGEMGLRVDLTRETDRFVGLQDRVEVARSLRADLFVSIHADSAPTPKARGLSAYTLSETASDDFAAALAQQENLAFGTDEDLSHISPQVQAILADLAAHRTKTASLWAKRRLVDGAGRDLRLLDNPMRSANFAVLKAPDVPSILVETGFLSNPQDEQLLRDPAARRRIAGVLARELSGVLSAAPFA